MRTYFQALQERRRKQFLSSATPKYKYLMELVGLCVRHLSIGPTPTPYQLDVEHEPKTTEFFCSQESDIFIPESKFLQRFFTEAKRNRSIWAIIKAHCHYAYNDQNTVQELFKTVEFGLSKLDFDNLRPFLCLFEALLEEPHQNFAQNRNAWLQRYMQIVKLNQTFFKWMETNFDFIFKLVGRHDHVRNWFYTNDRAWQFLVDWVGRHQRPPTMHTQGIKMYKTNKINVAQALQHYDHNEQGRNSLASAYRVRKLQEVISKNVLETKGEADVDKMDLQDYKFVAGDHITLVDRKSENAEEWKVVVVLDEMVSLQSVHADQMGKYQTRWQKCDTDKVYLGDTYMNLSKTRVRRDIYEKKLNPPQRKEREGAATDPPARAEADEQMPSEGAKEGEKGQQAEMSDYGSSEEDQNDQTDMCT